MSCHPQKVNFKRKEQTLIAVVDYKKGNLQSVVRGIEAAGATARIAVEPEEISSATAIVLPGVGAFTDAITTMNCLGQSSAIQKAVELGVPFLGICLGMHLMFEYGEEHAPDNSLTSGLGFLTGVVRKIPRTDARGDLFKVPHVGWNSVDLKATECPLFTGISSGEYFYFTHSYIAPEGSATYAHTQHSVVFPSVVWKDNMFGVQFHPEKSSDIGAKLLANFVSYVRQSC